MKSTYFCPQIETHRIEQNVAQRVVLSVYHSLLDILPAAGVFWCPQGIQCLLVQFEAALQTQTRSPFPCEPDF